MFQVLKNNQLQAEQSVKDAQSTISHHSMLGPVSIVFAEHVGKDQHSI